MTTYRDVLLHGDAPLSLSEYGPATTVKDGQFAWSAETAALQSALDAECREPVDAEDESLLYAEFCSLVPNLRETQPDAHRALLDAIRREGLHDPDFDPEGWNWA